jgi:arabinosaccharide transport system substrate-binding protein
MISFPYGKAALTILGIALISGLGLLLQPIPKKTTTLTLWTFAKTHHDAYKEAIPAFEAKHPGVKVDVQLVHGQAVTQRLQAAFWADLDVPDLVEVEISSAGSFFRGPLDSIGFADITDRVKQEGLLEKMVAARFAPYTRKGRIFGLPHDVHPVQLAYRRDIFEQEGIDVNAIETWDDFIAVGRKLTIPGKRYMIELSDTGRDNVETMLFQRGGGYFDPEGNCILDNAAAVETMRFYVPLVAGPKKIGNTLGDQQILTKAVEDGYLLCLIAPDWRTKSFEMDIPRMAGKMGLMPLPAVRRGGPRTSTWGGTMLGITKNCQNQDLAWEFAKHLYLNNKDLADRFRGTNIIPPVRDAWNLPAFNEPRPYWSNQPLGATYAKLASEVPFQYTSPFISLAKNKLSEALVACTQYYNQNGENGFDAFVEQRLRQSAQEVRRMIARNPY